MVGRPDDRMVGLAEEPYGGDVWVILMAAGVVGVLFLGLWGWTVQEELTRKREATKQGSGGWNKKDGKSGKGAAEDPLPIFAVSRLRARLPWDFTLFWVQPFFAAPPEAGG